MIGNRVKSFSYKVGTVIVRWYIGPGKGLADEIFTNEVVANVNVLSSKIVDCVLSHIDARGIICHNPYRDSVTEL